MGKNGSAVLYLSIMFLVNNRGHSCCGRFDILLIDYTDGISSVTDLLTGMFQ
jgi:hypothetical protein